MTEINEEIDVLCLSYNHEKYIEKALNGILNQNIKCRYKVLIHDDASTDNSAKIIKEYESRYPDIINAICQTENQYSQGKGITRRFILPIAKAKYFAYCECDDEWLDPNKLQIQYDYMESHPECSVCVHQGISNDLEKNYKSMCINERKERDFSIDEVIVMGNAFPTCSIFVRSKYIREMPDCFRMRGFGDYQIVLYATMNGACHYFPQPMCQYNLFVKGSFSSRIDNDISKKINHLNRLLSLLNNINEYTEYKYNKAFTKKINDAEFWLCVCNNDTKKMKEKKFRWNYIQYRIFNIVKKNNKLKNVSLKVRDVIERIIGD